uniref:Si:dkey-49c17.4 n=1 Tax=Kryptolebias marmoratus TaxID=37003 RepID=A0A3Q3A7C3_KRYMA
MLNGVSCKVCSYQDVLDYLNLTVDNSVFKLTRPVLDHTHTTILFKVTLSKHFTSAVILTVIVIILLQQWNNERISWDPAQFCGITRLSVPENLLWKPDLFIYEMTQKDEAPLSPYLQVSYNGTVSSEDEMRVVSTCKMDVHKFPFDTQECNMTIGSAIHFVEEMRFFPYSNSSRSALVGDSQHGELAQNLSVCEGNRPNLISVAVNRIFEFLDPNLDVTIKRRPLLHVINFLLPILFFLIMDLASFFIADHRGEKLSFKVTVLLAISVLLLILNDILPSMSNKTPLIATYCIVIFALMLLSLLETILVTYLMEKDSKDELQDNKEDKHKLVQTENYNTGENYMTGEELKRESHVLLLILDELKKLQKNAYLHHGCKEESTKSVYWAKRINRAFFVFYVVTVLLFLSFIFMEWNS